MKWRVRSNFLIESMGEKFDLNSLRGLGVPQNEPLDDKGRQLLEALEQHRSLLEGTKEERITALEAEIARLEAEIRQWVSPIQRFDALSPEEQQARMARELTGVVPENEWDISIYRSGLEQQSNKNPDELRLSLAKAQLQKLRAEV